MNYIYSAVGKGRVSSPKSSSWSPLSARRPASQNHHNRSIRSHCAPCPIISRPTFTSLRSSRPSLDPVLRIEVDLLAASSSETGLRRFHRIRKSRQIDSAKALELSGRKKQKVVSQKSTDLIASSTHRFAQPRPQTPSGRAHLAPRAIRQCRKGSRIQRPVPGRRG